MMTQNVTTDYVADFQVELDNIDKLEETPEFIRSIAIEALDRAAKTDGVPRTVKKALENSKRSLENINHQSIVDNFQVIYAQMCILAVSSLEATLKKYFVNMLKDPKNIKYDNKKLQEVKLTLKDIIDNDLRFGGKIGQIILEKASLNFQDLQAIKRNFKEFSYKEIKLTDQTEKNICFYLEARHILVHKGGIVDNKFVNATNSFNANIKSYKEGDRIELGSDDWSNIRRVFLELVRATTKRRGNR
jgi:uncharacterized protein (UPF0147 family)